MKNIPIIVATILVIMGASCLLLSVFFPAFDAWIFRMIYGNSHALLMSQAQSLLMITRVIPCVIMLIGFLIYIGSWFWRRLRP